MLSEPPRQLDSTDDPRAVIIGLHGVAGVRLYKELAERAIAEDKDGLGVQAQRLHIIAKALRVIK